MAVQGNTLPHLEWKDTSVPDIQICETGAIRRKSTRKIMAQHLAGPKNNDYYYCVLHRNKKVRVSVFICQEWHGPRPSKLHFALHSNGDRYDNRPANLRWGTQKENRADMFEHGTIIHGEKNPRAFLKEWQVREIRRLLPQDRKRGQLPLIEDVAKQFGISRSLASQISRRETWIHLD